MKKIFLILVILHLSILAVFSQLIDNKLNLYFSAGINSCIGEKNVNEDGFISPSLFTNYQKGFNYKINVSYKLIPYAGITAQLRISNFNGWNNGTIAGLYEDSKSTIKSFGVGFFIQPKFSSTGIFNRFLASVIFTPTYNLINVKLERGVYEYNPIYLQKDDLLNSNISSIGADLNLNLKYSITQRYAVFAESGLSYFPLKSQLYNDNRFLSFNTNIGFCLILMQDKHFLYH